MRALSQPRMLAEAALCGLAWGLCTPAPSTLGILLVVTTGWRAGHWATDARRGALAGAMWGGVWFAVALSWFPATWQDFTSTAGWGPFLVLWAMLAAPVAIAGGLAGSWSGRWWAWPLAMAAHEAAVAWLPLPAATALVLAESGAWLAPAALSRPLLAALAFLPGALGRRAALVVLLGWGGVGMVWASWSATATASTRVAIVQPDVGRMEGRTPASRERRAARLALLLPQSEGADWVALPEDGWPDDPGTGPGVRRRALLEAWQGLPPAVIGATVRAPDGDRNRLLVVEDGAVGAHFDKHWLVPAFERRWWGLGTDRYVAGDTPRRLEVAGVVVGPLICYEDLWPRGAREARRQGAQVLLAASNDSWLGPRGARQHLAFARLAAVSAGLWLVRPTSSGASAVLDPTGQVVWSTRWVDGDDPANTGVTRIVTVGLR